MGCIRAAATVKDAYDREKERAISNYWKLHRAAIKDIRLVANALGDKERINLLADELNKKVDKLQASVPDNVAAVDALVGSAMIVPTTKDMWAEAAIRFRESRPPGQRSQKSSVTDCVLWQVVVANSPSGVTFCSNNKKDFSDPKNEEKLHPSLLEELGGASKNFCYHSLLGFQKHHLQSVEVVVGPVFDNAMQCFHCGAETEPGLIPRPSQFGGWSYQKFCRKCGKYSDTGEPFDE